MSSTELSSVVEGVDLLTLSTAAGSSQYYRVKDGSIEFRPRTLAQWRRLAPTDVLQHVELGTIVAHWLKARLAASRS